MADIAVKCSTIEQKAEVIKYARKGEASYTPSKTTDDCINLESGCNSTEKWYTDEGFHIIPYEEFEKTYLKKVKMNSYTDFPFIAGGIYVGTWRDRRVIFKTFTGCLDEQCQLIASDDIYQDQKGCCNSNGITFREATTDEKTWLEACIKANKFIPREEALKPKIMNFEKGKWYEFRVKWATDIQQGKFERDNDGSLHFSPWIINSSTCSASGSFTFADIEESKEIDSSVIQKHLPEGHADKIVIASKVSKFEIGKWYFIKCYNSDWWLKVKNVENNGVDGVYHIMNGKCYDIGRWPLSSITDMKEVKVTIPEIQSCLKKGHPDKMTGDPIIEDMRTKQKAMKFNVGDDVSFSNVDLDRIPDYESSVIPTHLIKHGSTVFKENKGKIEHIHNEYYIVSFVDISGQIVQLRFKEEVLQVIKPKVVVLKEGMYLKALKDGPQGCADLVKKGDYGKVTHLYSVGNSGILEFPKNKYYSFTLIDNLYEMMPEGWIPETAVAVKKSVKDIKYPDCIVIENKEQWEKVNSYHTLSNYWENRRYYLGNAKGSSTKRFEGLSTDQTPYNILCFVELTFPKIEASDFKNRWVKCLADNAYSSIVNGRKVEKGEHYELTGIDNNGDLILKNGNYCGRVSYGEDQQQWKDIDFKLMPIGWKPEPTPIAEKKVQEPEVDYIGQIIGHGEGMHSDDAGKHIRVLKGRPSGSITNDWKGYDLYIQGIPGVFYKTGFTGPHFYGRCSEKMVKKLDVPEKEWCVFMTPENNKDILEYFNKNTNSIYSGSGGWYGIRNGISECCSYPWDGKLTNKQWYAKIVKKQPKVQKASKGQLLLAIKTKNINTSVKKIRSISGNLIKRKEVVLF